LVEFRAGPPESGVSQAYGIGKGEAIIRLAEWGDPR